MLSQITNERNEIMEINIFVNYVQLKETEILTKILVCTRNNKV